MRYQNVVNNYFTDVPRRYIQILKIVTIHVDSLVGTCTCKTHVVYRTSQENVMSLSRLILMSLSRFILFRYNMF